MTKLKLTAPHFYEEPISSQLVEAIDLTKSVMRMRRPDGTFNARYAYRHIVSSMPFLWGPQLKNMALGEDLPDCAAQGEKLNALADRLDTLCGDDLPNDVRKAIDDIRAMSKGDEAQFLVPAARDGNYRTNAYRLARHQLRALEWVKLLVFHGNSVGESQTTVAYHYGTTWDAIRKWEATIKLMLGADFVSSTLDRAARGQSILTFDLQKNTDVAGLIARDGLAYQKELSKQQ